MVRPNRSRRISHPTERRRFALPELAAYGLRVLPGLLLIGGCFALARGERDPLLRIVTLILAFVLVGTR